MSEANRWKGFGIALVVFLIAMSTIPQVASIVFVGMGISWLGFMIAQAIENCH